MKKLFLLLCLMVTFFLSACQNPGTNAYYLGNRAYANGQYKAAFDYYLYAARYNITPAQYAVGYQYYYGIGTQSDMFKSLYWFKKAAPQSQRARFAIQQMTTQTDRQPWAVGLHWHDKPVPEL